MTGRGTRKSFGVLQCPVPCSECHLPECAGIHGALQSQCVHFSACEDGEKGMESLKRHCWASPLVTELWPHWQGAGPPAALRVIQKDHRKAESRGGDDDTITEQFQDSFPGCQKLICRCSGCCHITSCWQREKLASSCFLLPNPEHIS